MSDTLAWVSTIAQTRKRNVEWVRSAVIESASVTETEALSKGVVDLIAEDVDSLLVKIDGRRVKINNKTIRLETKNAELIRIDLDKRQQFLNVVTNPTIAYILMILGFYGLLFEFTHPGIGFPGIAGTIAIILEVILLAAIAYVILNGVRLTALDLGIGSKYNKAITLALIVVGCIVVVFFIAHLMAWYPEI